MKIELPKDLRTFAFTELTLVELNDIVIERMIGHLFEMAIKNGRTVSLPKNADKYDDALETLAAHPQLSGFDGKYGRAVLDGLTRSTVVAMGKAGLRRDREQMQYLYPTNVAVYRAGFPSRARHRQADGLIYREMLAAIGARPKLDERSPRLQLSDLFRSCFGQGVTITDAPRWEPKYDGNAEIDASSLLSLYFSEFFEAKAATKGEPDVEALSSLPAATRPMGLETVQFLEAYGRTTPTRTLTSSMSALLGFRLFQLPLRLGLGIRHLLDDGELPPDMSQASTTNPLDQYVDFTGVPNSSSVRLAQACVQRDLSILTRSLSDRLTLKSVHEAAEAMAVPIVGTPRTAQWFASMAALRDDERISPYLAMRFRQVVQENAEAEDGDAAEFIESLASSSRSPSEKLTELLTEALRKRGHENAVKWFWSTGGINTDVGILSGTLKLRQSWTYAPKDALIVTLLASVFTTSGPVPRQTLPFETVLRRFETDFGILIARPPSAMNDSENRAAAEANLAAFKRRLQLLGVFDGLSDDFSTQNVRNPLVGKGGSE